MQDQIDELLTVDQAGRFLGLKPATIRRMVWDGQLPVIRPTANRAIRFSRKDLESLVRMRTTPIRVKGQGISA